MCKIERAKSSAVTILHFVLLLSCPAYSQDVALRHFEERPVPEDAIGPGVPIIVSDDFIPAYQEKSRQAAITYLAWSKKGDHLALRLSEIHSGEGDAIWLYSFPDKSLTNLTAGYLQPEGYTINASIPIWDVDDSLVFNLVNYPPRPDGAAGEISVRTRPDFGGLDETLLPDSLVDRRIYSPDKKFFYASSDQLSGDVGTGNNVIFSIGAKPSAGGSIGQAGFSSDSRYLAVSQFMGSGGGGRLFLVNPGNGEISLVDMKLRFVEIMGASNWHPTKPVVHIPDLQHNLHLPDLDTNIDHVIKFGNYFFSNAAWSPDGKKLAVVLREKTSNQLVVNIIDSPV